MPSRTFVLPIPMTRISMLLPILIVSLIFLDKTNINRAPFSILVLAHGVVLHKTQKNAGCAHSAKGAISGVANATLGVAFLFLQNLFC